MKFLSITLFVTVSLLITSASFAADQPAQQTALQSFQPIQKEITTFFASNPKLLVKISPPDHAEQSAYFTSHFSYRQSVYDIVTTNSIVTPYQGIIDIDTDVFDNKACGDISFDNKVKDGWAKADMAIQFSNNPNCYVSRTKESGPISHRFTFAYQALDKQWVLTEISYRNGQPNGRFLVLLGISSPWFPVIDDAKAREFNKTWYDLFKHL